MSEPRYPAAPQASGPSGCPPVADLILFGLGQMQPDERRPIEMHQATCASCRGWIARAQRLRPELPPKPAGYPLSFASLARSRAPASPHAAAESPSSQRQAFEDLAKRLRQLDDEQ